MRDCGHRRRIVATIAALAAIAVPMGLVAAAPAQATTSTSTIDFTVVTTGSVEEQQLLGGEAAQFTDTANAAPNASDYGATFDWGDGTVFTTQAGTVTITCSGTTCTISVSGHAYADEGVYTVVATAYPVGDDATSPTASSIQGTLTATDRDVLSGTGTDVAGDTGVALDNVETATFNDTLQSATADDFVASIDWGDGTVGSGTVSGVPDSFVVTGSHTYADKGSYTVATTLTDDSPGTATASTTSTAVIGAQSITFSPPAVATVGDSGTPSATGGDSGNPVTFTIDPATTNNACTLSGTVPDKVSYNHVGNCVLDANQAGNTDFAPAPQVSGTTAVGPATPTVTLTATPPDGSVPGDSVTLTAGVAGVPGGPEPTGTVTFTAGGTEIPGCIDVALTAGSATCTTTELPLGTDDLLATYNHDADNTTATGSLSYVVSKIQVTTTVVSSKSPTVFGEEPSFSATLSPAPPSGDIQWTVDGNPIGSAVPLVSGVATLGPLPDLSVGTHDITADYAGDSRYTDSTGSMQQVVGKADTSTALVVTAGELTASVAPVAPGAGTPSGTVDFMVGATTVGSAPVGVDGTAALSYVSSGAEVASATYEGDDSFLGSSASTTTHNPTITAHVTSASAKTASGWYRSPVTVRFTCATNGAALITPGCPAPVTLRHQGAARSVTKTVHAVDGGVATVTVSPINIDTTAPRLRVAGVTSGRVYDAPGPMHVRCVAHDPLSGLAAPCRLTRSRHGSVVRYTGTAVDRAGNVRRVHGSYRVVNYFVVGARRTGGRYDVKVGHHYLVEAYVRHGALPVYTQAAPAGRRPTRNAQMHRVAGHLWAIRISITPQMRSYAHWTLGVTVDGAMHLIPITVRG